MSSPSRAMPPVTATRTQAAWVIWWSAARMACATATPPLNLSCSSVPASCCHWAGVTGSLADRGARRRRACSMPAELLLHGPDPASAAL